MTVMCVTVHHSDGYEQSYAAAIPDKTPLEAYEDRLETARRGGGLDVDADLDALTIRITGTFLTTEITFSGDLTMHEEMTR